LKEDLAQRKYEHLFCLEFDLRPTLPLSCDLNSELYGSDIFKDQLESEDEYLAALVRMIDQDMVGQTVMLYINGECHG